MVYRGFVTLLLAATLLAPHPAAAQSAGDFNSERLENDTTFDVPAEHVEAVWQYLLDQYGNSPNNLKTIDPQLSAVSSDEVFVDTYFDTPQLTLMGEGTGLRYRRRSNISNPEDRKNGRELIQLKFGTAPGETEARPEYKYPVELPDVINSYNDKHPFLHLMDKSSRLEVTTRLAEVGVNAQHVRPILTLNQRRRRIAILRGGQPFIGFSLDGTDSKRLWHTIHFDQIELELNEIAFTEATAEEREHMKNVRNEMVQALLKEFPNLHKNPETKYEKAFARLAQKIPWYRFWIHIGIL